jgi:transposase
MPGQDTIEELPSQEREKSRRSQEGIIVPLDLPEMQIVGQRLGEDGSLEVEIIGVEARAICPHCQRSSAKIHDTRVRKKRDCSLRGYRVVLWLYKRRFKCFGCQRTFTEPDVTCGKYRRTTARLRTAIGKQGCQHPVAQVAAEHQVGPRFVQECVDEWAKAELARHQRALAESGKLSTPRFLGIDEFARRKGHVYDTILCDLESRSVIEVSEGRKQEEVARLLERLDDPDAVEAVSMDMSKSFRSAVELCLPKAQIVVDHFHVIQHVMKGFRKVVSSFAHKAESKALLEGKQYLFLRAKEDLTAEQAQERASLADQLPVLETAWQLKEELRTWYATASATTAAQELDVWIARVRQLGPDPLRKTLSAFTTWRNEILAFFHFLPIRISNGFVEGKNNRTKALMRRAYGYRNRQHLRLRILLEDVA